MGLALYFAHFLWTVANDPSWGHAAAKRAALDFMKNYADFLVTSNDKKYLSMGNLVQMFFMTRVPGPTLCQQIQTQFFAELNTYNCGLYNQAGGGQNQVVGLPAAGGRKCNAIRSWSRSMRNLKGFLLILILGVSFKANASSEMYLGPTLGATSMSSADGSLKS